MILAAKKPVTVQAWRILAPTDILRAQLECADENWDPPKAAIGPSDLSRADGWFVHDMLQGTIVFGKWGDYLMRGVKGEFYPCDAEVFDATYEVRAPEVSG